MELDSHQAIITLGYHSTEIMINKTKEETMLKNLESIKTFQDLLNPGRSLSFGEILTLNRYFVLYISSWCEGSSGGPIIDVNSGKVIGVITGSFDDKTTGDKKKFFKDKSNKYNVDVYVQEQKESYKVVKNYNIGFTFPNPSIIKWLELERGG
jgi:hypothetical protein